MKKLNRNKWRNKVKKNIQKFFFLTIFKCRALCALFHATYLKYINYICGQAPVGL